MIATLLQDAGGGLTTGGWVVMLGSIGLVVGLAAWCISKILSEPDPGSHHHAPLEIDPGDRD